MIGASIARSRNAEALVKKLSDTLKGSGKPRKRGGRPSNRRVDIVSESLCDDVINYLSPTLEQHKGCALIDIYPGACLFSSRLHELLKPKSHILVEPEKRYFEPFIKPLLDRPGSTYSHSIPAGLSADSQWSSVRKLYKNGSTLIDRQSLAPPNLGQKQFDPSVLVIGNLAQRRHRNNYLKSTDLAPLALYHMGYDILANEFLQADWRFRMLWWLPDSYKPAILPRHSLHNRSSFNVGLDMAFNMTEVVGVTSTQALKDSIKSESEIVLRRRLKVLDGINDQAVASGMRKRGFVAPEGRPVQKMTQNSLRPDRYVGALSPFARIAKDSAALSEKISGLASRFEEHSPWLRSSRSLYARHRGLIQAAIKTLEYPQCKSADLQPRRRKIESSKERVAVMFDLGLRLLSIEASFKSLEAERIEQATLDSLRNEVLSLEKSFNEMLGISSLKTQVLIEGLLEDQLAFYSSSPLMAWDRRSYEPLQADASDFWPKLEMSLFDFVPKNVDLSVNDLADSRECSRFCAEMLKTLFSAKTQPLPLALEKIGVNAGKDLIPMVPAITDVRKGGRLNPDSLKVRMLTTEMVEGLVKAFFEWPFRPERWELTLAHEEPKELSKSSESEPQIVLAS